MAARRKKATTGKPISLPRILVKAPGDQTFECRDCPARCCRMPWRICFSEEETSRYLDEPFVRERAGAAGVTVLARGTLPVREVDRGVQCVFLDDDLLCALQKKFGHAYIPRACQTFPFGFVTDENDSVTANVSQLCPSIRDNYGEPIGPQVEAKLAQRGGPQRMSTALAARDGTILKRPQYLAIANHWRNELADGSPASALARLYDRTSALERLLPPGVAKPADDEVMEALRRALEHDDETLARRERSSWHARLLFSFLLGNLCYPSRVRLDHRADRGRLPLAQALRAFGNKVAWLLELGTVDLLFIDRPVPLARVRRVARFLDTERAAPIRDYLRLALDRRQVFSEPRHLMAVLLDLALATVVISRFARCRAAAAGLDEVRDEDVREGIGVAELVLLAHASLGDQGRLLKNLRWLLLTHREKFRGLLASEA